MAEAGQRRAFELDNRKVETDYVLSEAISLYLT
jgi:hypothetical protein